MHDLKKKHEELLADEFSTYYKEKIYPSLLDLEKKRNELLQHSTPAKLGNIPFELNQQSLIYVLLIVGLILLFSSSLIFVLIIAILPVIIANIAWKNRAIMGKQKKMKLEYEAIFHSTILKKICDFFYWQYEHNPYDKFDIRRFYDIGLITSFSDKRMEDLISGEHDKTKIAITYAKLYKLLGIQADNGFPTSLKNEVLEISLTHGIRYRKLDLDESAVFDLIAAGYKDPKGTLFFEGLFFVCTFHKSFLNKTLVVNKKNQHISNFLQTAFLELEHIELEDIEFNRLFDVYSGDQVEARYLLTTEFMERLRKLGTAFHTSDIYCAFHENQLLLVIPHKDTLFKKIHINESAMLAEQKIKETFQNLCFVLDVLDILKVNVKANSGK